MYNGSVAYGIQSACIDNDDFGDWCNEGDTTDNAIYGHISNVFSELTEQGGWMTLYTGD